jgi:hypothetical protein
VAGLLFLAITTVVTGNSPGQSETIPPDQPSQVRGQLVMLSRDVIVVVSPEGTNIIIPLVPDAHIDHALKEGEQVLVLISADRAVAVRRVLP